MVTRTLLILIALGSSSLTGIAQAQPAGDWVEHRNEKYGFRLEYPADVFKLERTTQAGDGHGFVSADGKARLLVGALQNDEGSTPAAYQDYIARNSYGSFKVTYRPLGETWFVLSGEGDGKIFYEKVIFSCSGKLINSFAMVYPIDSRSVFDPLLERMEDSFRAGLSCEHAGPPARSGKQRRTDASPKSSKKRIASPRRPRVKSRPEQADRSRWVLRGSGGPGYVILQRTSPPYETKIVRGQAF